MTAAAAEGMSSYAQALKQLLQDASARADAEFAASRRAAGAIKRRAAAVDAVLCDLWQSLEIEAVARAAGAVEAPALLATGGYGSGGLYPGSDIDILVLLPEQTPAELDGRIRSFLAAAWDLGLELAQAVRPWDDLRNFAREDLSGYTSLLDARLLAGGEALYKRLQAWIRSDDSWSPARFLAGKRAELQERWSRQADTAHNLEPNLKTSRGGLRDLRTLEWVARRSFGKGRLKDLVALGHLEPDEARSLEAAGRWLGDLRYALHRLVGRREDRLLFDHQPRLAQVFGEDEGLHHGVESLMQRYFRAAQTIDRIGEQLLLRIEDALLPSLRHPAPLPDAPGFAIDGQRLELSTQHPGFATPESLVEPFLWLARRPELLGLGPGLLRALARARSSQGKALARSQAAQERLIDILRTRQPFRALSTMHRHGLLGLLIPPFANVSGRMQYDLFHVYTVDQHTLFLLRNLEQFFQADGPPELSQERQLAARVRQPELLFLAALFHDIAKGRGGDHSELGAKDARRYLGKLGFAAADIDLVAWLVQSHLLMSVTAQKQDIQDPDVVRRFAVQVGDWERLECLYLLTGADIRATNPKLWNGWKARLLSDLYRAARFQLRRGIDQPVHRQDRIHATRLKALEALTGEGALFNVVESVWSDFPDQSFWRYTPDQLRWLTQSIIGSARPGEPLVAVRSVGTEGTREVFVRMADQHGIFATIASVLDRLDLSVQSARIMTCRSGMTLDTFQVIDMRAAEIDAFSRNIEIQMALKMALARNPLEPKLARRKATREQRHFRFSPEISFDARGEDRATQLALVCPDRPGLLARVARAFLDCNLRVHSARIATFGERAEDFFQISTARGEALAEDDCERLRQALLARTEELW